MDRDYKIVVTNQSSGASGTIFFSELALQSLLRDLAEDKRWLNHSTMRSEQFDAAASKLELIRALSDLSTSDQRPSEGGSDHFIGDSDLSM